MTFLGRPCGESDAWESVGMDNMINADGDNTATRACRTVALAPSPPTASIGLNRFTAIA